MEWRPKRTPGTNIRPRLPAWLQWIPTVVAVIATAARYLVGIAAGIGLAWLLIRLQRRSATRTSPGVGAAPAVLFGLDVRPESLPADLVARARQLALAGNVTAALALLYRGALVALVHGAGVQFKDGDTERDCLRRAGGALQGVELAYFGTLVRSWQHAAYAHTAPHPDAVLGLCDQWPALLRSAGDARMSRRLIWSAGRPRGLPGARRLVVLEHLRARVRAAQGRPAGRGARESVPGPRTVSRANGQARHPHNRGGHPPSVARHRARSSSIEDVRIT